MSVSRRSLVKGAAWTAPTIVVAAAAPAIAASPSVPSFEVGQKCPGASDVPRGYGKHSYVIAFTSSQPLEIVQVRAGTKEAAFEVVAQGGTRYDLWVDADASPSTVTVVTTSGTHVVPTVPHCGRKWADR